MPSYTARELERESGFDRRTIAYYVQEGLLPKVGRRGPRTRYPQLFLDRLLFIRRVREAEEEGTIPPLSLSDLGEVFERISPALIARAADGRIAVTPELVSPPTTAFLLPEMEATMEPVGRLHGPGSRSFETPRARRERMESRLLRMAESPAAPMEAGPTRMDSPAGEVEAPPEDADPAPAPASPSEPVFGYARAEPGYGPDHLVRLLAEVERVGRHRQGTSRKVVETWSRIRISPNLELSVRGLADEHKSLMDTVRRVMRRLLQIPGSTRHPDPASGEGRRER